MSTMREEIEEILVDSYGEYEQMTSWECAFTDEVAMPFPASLLGMTVQVKAFRISDADRLQCLVVREQEQKRQGLRERWISVEELDDEPLPEDCGHLLMLYKTWLDGSF